MIIWWLTTLAWAAEIFYLSTQRFAGSLSQSLLARVLVSLHVSVSPDALEKLDSLLRKLAHLTEYALFSLFLYQCFSGPREFHWSPRLAHWSVGVAAVYSLTDEFHQAFVPGRNASLLDCGLDASGAVIAMLLVYGTWRLTAMVGRKSLAH
jgi:VanZ family protein